MRGRVGEMRVRREVYSQLIVLLALLFARPLLECVSRHGISKLKLARGRSAREQAMEARARRLQVMEGSCMVEDDDDVCVL